MQDDFHLRLRDQIQRLLLPGEENRYIHDAGFHADINRRAREALAEEDRNRTNKLTEEAP